MKFCAHHAVYITYDLWRFLHNDINKYGGVAECWLEDVHNKNLLKLKQSRKNATTLGVNLKDITKQTYTCILFTWVEY